MEKITTESEVVAFAAEAARGREVEAGDHPADLNEHEVGKRPDGLVVDRLAALDVGDYDRIRRRRDRKIPERPRIALPVGMRNLVLEHAEDVQLVRIPDGVGGCAKKCSIGWIVRLFDFRRQITAIVVKYGLEDDLPDFP